MRRGSMIEQAGLVPDAAEDWPARIAIAPRDDGARVQELAVEALFFDPPGAAALGIGDGAWDVADALFFRGIAHRPAPGDSGAETAPLAELPLRPEPEPFYTAADFTGAGQTIAVIDTGWSPFYDQSSLVFDFDFAGIFDDPDASVLTLQSHGSWVAQTAVGVAPDVQIVHFKVFPDAGGSASLGDIEQALDFILDHNSFLDITAVNLSLGFGNATSQVLTGLSDEFAALDAAGIFPIAAAGNSGAQFAEGVNVIAADPNVIAVSAVDALGRFAGFSQIDPDLTDIAAPGVGIPVETLNGVTGSVSGTSFSAPMVAGIAARLQHAAETLLGTRLTDEQFVEILQTSGEAVTGIGEDGPDGYRIADSDAALDHFLANLGDYGDPLML